MCSVLYIIVCIFVLCFVIVLSLLRFTASVYTFSILKSFLTKKKPVVSWRSVFLGGGNRIKPQTCRMIILSCGPMLKGIIFILKKNTWLLHLNNSNINKYLNVNFVNL